VKRLLHAILASVVAIAACAPSAEDGAPAMDAAASATAADTGAAPDAAAHAGHDDAAAAGAATAALVADAAAHDAHAGHAGQQAPQAAVRPAAAAGGGAPVVHAGHAGHAGHASAAPAAPAAHATHAAPAAQAGHAGHTMPELPATAGPGYTVADVYFMQMMMGHHAQALVMAEKAPTHGADGMVLRLAEKIDISQRDEIAMMAQWLRERGQAVPTEAQMLAMHMPGMLTPEQMRQLDAVRGRAFDRLFLTLMIQHHEGAILMVDELFASPGAGQDSDIFRFASDVAADQGDEIFVMYRLLQMLAEGGDSAA
jgi:uncharacterized protein (DUF305 family)